MLAGSFEIFREDDLPVDAVLASAAEPYLFAAVRIGDRYYWDGLFSRNPPMKNFLTETDVPDPDEIRLVEINPQQQSQVPTTVEEIHDRRNELAGNLSLNAEVGFPERSTSGSSRTTCRVTSPTRRSNAFGSLTDPAILANEARP